MFYTWIPSQWCGEHLNCRSYEKVMPPMNWPTRLITIVQEDATLEPITHTYGDIDMEFQEYYISSKPCH